MSPFATFTGMVGVHRPRVALVLGSGLGAVPHRFTEVAAIPFGEVPNLVTPSVHGHSGKIGLGHCAGVALLVFRGRLHYYEGHSWDQVAAPVKLMANWGVKTLFLTNAAGGIHDRLWPGDLMVLRDHLWLQIARPVGQVSHLAGNRDRLETCPTSSPKIIELFQTAEPERDLLAATYAALTGPCYETPAEIRPLKAMGADAVGMSTAFEARTAVDLGLEV